MYGCESILALFNKSKIGFHIMTFPDKDGHVILANKSLVGERLSPEGLFMLFVPWGRQSMDTSMANTACEFLAININVFI